MTHRVICPLRSMWRKRRYHQPLWIDDKVAQRLGVAWYGCRRCGRGAIAERDAAFPGTCPTLCVETNHRGLEHEEWVSLI
jgi:hypothetical protein